MSTPLTNVLDAPYSTPLVETANQENTPAGVTPSIKSDTQSYRNRVIELETQLKVAQDTIEELTKALKKERKFGNIALGKTIETLRKLSEHDQEMRSGILPILEALLQDRQET